MIQKPAEVDKGTEKAEGLTLDELEAQVGDLLPDRVEMRRRRQRQHCLVLLGLCAIGYY